MRPEGGGGKVVVCMQAASMYSFVFTMSVIVFATYRNIMIMKCLQ